MSDITDEEAAKLWFTRDVLMPGFYHVPRQMVEEDPESAYDTDMRVDRANKRIKFVLTRYPKGEWESRMELLARATGPVPPLLPSTVICYLELSDTADNSYKPRFNRMIAEMKSHICALCPNETLTIPFPDQLKMAVGT